MSNSELIAQIEAATNEEIMCRAACDTSDNWQDVVSPENVLKLLAYVRELEADKQSLKARVRELGERCTNGLEILHDWDGLNPGDGQLAIRRATRVIHGIPVKVEG